MAETDPVFFALGKVTIANALNARDIIKLKPITGNTRTEA